MGCPSGEKLETWHCATSLLGKVMVSSEKPVKTVERHDSSFTCPTILVVPFMISSQSPISKVLSICKEMPANRFPSVSCKARPRTIENAADVAKRGVSCTPNKALKVQKPIKIERTSEKILTNNKGTPARIEPKNMYCKTSNRQAFTKKKAPINAPNDSAANPNYMILFFC